MSDQLERLEARLEALSRRIARLEDAVLHDGAEPPYTPDVEDDTEPAAQPGPGISAGTAVQLAGRSLVVMGGAFLLRWLTQKGTLPPEAGSVLGMAYALLWIVMADVAAGRGRRMSAVFHGVIGAFIALPLLVEATTSFRFLTPTLSAASLLAFVLLGLTVAGRRNLRLLAWIVALPVAPLAFILAGQTGTLTPFLISLLGLGFVTLWLGYIHRWWVLATLMAFATNAGMGLVVLERVKSPGTTTTGQMSLEAALMLLFSLIALYFGSYCFRVFRRKRTITPLEIGNTLTVILVGLGGAALVLRAEGHSMLPIGVVSMVLSAACYVAAYGFLPRQDPNRTNFLFFTLLGITMALLGFELTLSPATAALVFAAIGIAAAAASKPVDSPVLFLHGAAYLIVAVIGTGLAGATAGSLTGATAPLSAWSVPALVALAGTLVLPWVNRPQGRAIDMTTARRAVDACLLISSLALCGLAASLFAGVITSATEPDRVVLATLRTAVLALAAVDLSWASRRWRLPDLAWLVYLILALGAVKLGVEDLRAGGTARLFVSLALYGGALILSPRLLRRGPARPAGGSAS